VRSRPASPTKRFMVSHETFVRAPTRAARSALGEVSNVRGCVGHFPPGIPQAVVWEPVNGH
jgi:AMMECR1 domain-containing protein